MWLFTLCFLAAALTFIGMATTFFKPAETASSANTSAALREPISASLWSGLFLFFSAAGFSGLQSWLAERREDEQRQKRVLRLLRDVGRRRCVDDRETRTC